MVIGYGAGQLNVHMFRAAAVSLTTHPLTQLTTTDQPLLLPAVSVTHCSHPLRAFSDV